MANNKMTKDTLDKHLKRIGFGKGIWGKAELAELPNILHEDEDVKECVNGYYEGGFALLVATDMRVVLIDKKPLNYLTVEDLRFDMINEIDYNHRLLGAYVKIATGMKTLRFSSYNQARLRKLIDHVQERMSEIKKEHKQSQDTQQQHLEKMNEQLQAYLLAQQKQIDTLRDANMRGVNLRPEPLKPQPELADFLFAQGLMKQYRQPDEGAGQPDKPAAAAEQNRPQGEPQPEEHVLYDREAPAPQPSAASAGAPQARLTEYLYEQDMPEAAIVNQQASGGMEVNPLRVAAAQLPLMLRNRKFGRPSLRMHSGQAASPASGQQ